MSHSDELVLTAGGACPPCPVHLSGSVSMVRSRISRRPGALDAPCRRSGHWPAGAAAATPCARAPGAGDRRRRRLVGHGTEPSPSAVLPGLGWLSAFWLRLSEDPLYDLELVKGKLSWPAARAELRLAVFAPASAPPGKVQARLDHLVAAYHAYDLQRGN